MHRKHLTLLLTAGVGMVLSLTVLLQPVWSAKSSTPAKPSVLTILYTCRAHGMIRSCNCTKFRYGGYGREYTMVAQTRRTVRNLILVEGGDIVGPFRTDEDKLKAGVALRSLKMMGYASMTPGEAEASVGLDQIQALAPQPAAPLVVANLQAKTPADLPATKPFVVRRTNGGLRVAIIGLLSPRLLQASPQRMTVGATDPLVALKKVLPAARKAADFVVVVAHSTREDAEAIARNGGVDIVICSHPQGDLIMPTKPNYTVDAPIEKIGNCVFVMGGTRSAWSVGRVDLELDKGKVRTYRHCLCYLDHSYAESPQALKLYDDYNQRVREIVLKRDQKLRSELTARMTKRGYDLSKFQQKVFAGDSACKACHQTAYDVWSKSKHAAAFATLRKTKQEYDPDCIACHTTGQTVRGGFVNAKITPNLVNVQCEACHGPGIDHAAKPSSGYGEMEEEKCRACHTDDYNPDFDYEQRWKLIQH